MRIPEKLTVPAITKTYYQEDFEKDEDKTSVAAAFFKAKNQYNDEAMKKARYAVDHGTYREFSLSDQKKYQEELLCHLRPHIDRALQKAVINNGGAIDAFPPSSFSGLVTLSQTTYVRESTQGSSLLPDKENPWEEDDFKCQSFSITLDFFDGVENENGISYLSYYENPSAEKLVEKEKELKKRKELVLRRGKERLKKFIGSLPTVLALILSALLLYSVFENKELYDAITQYLPFYEICSKFTGISFVHLIGIPVLSLFVSAFLTGFLDPVIIRGVSKKQAVADYEEFIQSRDYLKAKEELEQEKPRYNKLMKEFYTAWYRHTKKNF